MSDIDEESQGQIFATTGNPVPEGAACGLVRTPDEVNIRYARWMPITHPSKGTVIILHGRTDCIEKETTHGGFYKFGTGYGGHDTSRWIWQFARICGISIGSA